MNYLILSTGRARSGVVASYLRKLGCGAPDEFYEQARFHLHTIAEPEGIKEYIEERRVNGIFGMKMVWSHVRKMNEVLRLKLKPFIDTYVPSPRYIFVTRDPIKQGIESVMYGMRKAGVAEKVDHFDKGAAWTRIQRAITGNHAWEFFFQKYGIRPIRVDSDTLEKDPNPVIEEIIKKLGVDIEMRHLDNSFRDSLMNPFRDKMYERFLRRYDLLMPDVDIKEYL